MWQCRETCKANITICFVISLLATPPPGWLMIFGIFPHQQVGVYVWSQFYYAWTQLHYSTLLPRDTISSVNVNIQTYYISQLYFGNISWQVDVVKLSVPQSLWDLLYRVKMKWLLKGLVLLSASITTYWAIVESRLGRKPECLIQKYYN